MLLYCTCLPTNSRGPACFTSTLKGTCCLPTSWVFLQPHAAGLQGNVLPGARPHAAAGQCTDFTEDLVTVDNMQAAHTCFMSTCLMQVSLPPSFTWSRISSTRTPVTGPSVSMTPTSSFSRTPETNPSVPLGQAIVPQQQQDLDTTYKVVKAMLAHSYMAIDSNRGHQMGDARDISPAQQHPVSQWRLSWGICLLSHLKGLSKY